MKQRKPSRQRGVDPAPAPKGRTPAPKGRTAAPKGRAPAPKGRAPDPAPKGRTPAPKGRAAAPKGRTPAPAPHGSAMKGRRFQVSASAAGMRLGSFLVEWLGKGTPGKRGSAGNASQSQRAVKRELERGCCTVNGKVESFASRRLALGDIVIFSGGDDPTVDRLLEVSAEKIIYEDDRYLAYDKPAGYPSQPGGSAHGGRNLYDELLAFVRARDPEAYLGQVHRLDRDTSGVILYVKREEDVARVSALFRARAVAKTYIALVHKAPSSPMGVWESRLEKRESVDKDSWASTKSPGGRVAITSYRVDRRFARAASLVHLEPRTGRTHQLRVHLAEAGCPIVGDARYGGAKPIDARSASKPILPARHMLHASALRFVDPETGRTLELISPLPEEFRAVIAAVEIATRK